MLFEDFYTCDCEEFQMVLVTVRSFRWCLWLWGVSDGACERGMVLLSEFCFTCSWEGPCHPALTMFSSVGLWMSFVMRPVWCLLWCGLWMSFVMQSVDVFCDAVCGCLLWCGLWMSFVMRSVDVFCDAVCGCLLWCSLWMSFVMRSVDVFCDVACAVLQTALARISSAGLWMSCVMQPVGVLCVAACVVCGCLLWCGLCCVAGRKTPVEVFTLNFWCMNPAVVSCDTVLGSNLVFYTQSTITVVSGCTIQCKTVYNNTGN